MREKARLATARNVTAESKVCNVNMRRTNCVPLVVRVVEVAGTERVQARFQLDDLDAMPAIDHGGKLAVGTKVIRAGITARRQLLAGQFGGLSGGTHFEKIATEQSPRPRFQGARTRARLVTATTSPN